MVSAPASPAPSLHLGPSAAGRPDSSSLPAGPLFNFDVHDDVRLLSDATVEKDEVRWPGGSGQEGRRPAAPS